MNPYVFFVGCPRSGTTLARRVADAHSQLAVMPEQHWLPRFWEWRAGLNSDGFVDSELLDMLLADRRFELLGLPFKPIADLVEHGPVIGYGTFVSALFDMYGAHVGKPHVGEKTPKYVTHLGTLDELWPAARVVHLIRDGRDVALSLREWDKAERNVGRFPGWLVDPITTAALYWEWSVRCGREDGGRLGGERYHELRYEDLVSDSERVCQELCSFLVLAFEPAMLRFHEGRQRQAPDTSAKKAWQPITPGLRDWRVQMSAAEIRSFEAAAGTLLDELGYERYARRIGRADKSYAAEFRRIFSDHLARWSRPIPAAWRKAAA